jgi:membrane protein implicated in regulation of membrane protease activity
MIWHMPWAWLAAGLLLAIAETILPGFILLGFAIGAVITGLCVWGGLLASAGLPALLLVFALASLAAWLALKQAFGIRGQKPKIWDRDINDN